MSDTIINLVNEAAEARREKWELDLAHIKKTTAVDANAMGILQYVIESCYRTAASKNDGIYVKIKMVYDWLDYSSSLPAKMFAEMGSGDRIWRNFRNLYDLYIQDGSSLTFVEWMEGTDKTKPHVNG